MVNTGTRQLRVFLCHASQDKPIARELYKRLQGEGWIDPWLDEEKLLPGQDWDLEIEKAVEAADAVVVCVSSRSVSKEGYVQKEIRKILDQALEKPEETIFIIPLRLDDCELPRRLRARHYVDYFPADGRSQAYRRLLQSLQLRSGQLQPGEPAGTAEPSAMLDSSPDLVEEKKPFAQETLHRMLNALRPTSAGEADIGLSLPLLFYFLMAGWDATSASNDTVEILLAVSAIVAGIALLLQRRMPATALFKGLLIAHLLITSFTNSLEEIYFRLPELGGVAAFAAGAIVLLTLREPRKRLVYSSIAFALFLFFLGIYWLGRHFALPNVDVFLPLTAIATSILLLADL